MTRALFLTPAIVWLAAGNAFADNPSFDCNKAGSSAEELICEDDGLAALDQRLSTTYKKAISAAQSMDSGSKEAVDMIRATQRGWIKGRDDCWKADDLRACVESAYLMREGELVANWMLQEPAAVVSYICDPNPANEVWVHFFDTELPSIRVEYGDGIKTGTLVPAASGSKYQIDSGGIFWSKGKDAQFAWEEGQEMSCTQAP